MQCLNLQEGSDGGSIHSRLPLLIRDCAIGATPRKVPDSWYREIWDLGGMEFTVEWTADVINFVVCGIIFCMCVLVGDR